VVGGGTKNIIVGTDIADNTGWKITTDAISSASIVFRDGTEIRLSPRSEFVVGDSNSLDSSSSVFGWFGQGAMHFLERVCNATSTCPQRYLRMRSQDRWIAASIRGTEFNVDYSGTDSDLVIRVNDGRVDVALSGETTTVRVSGGQAVEVGRYRIDPTSNWVFPWWNLPDNRILVAAGFLLYFLPTLVAAVRRRSGLGRVALLNLALGWTAVGWFLLTLREATGIGAPDGSPSARDRPPAQPMQQAQSARQYAEWARTPYWTGTHWMTHDQSMWFDGQTWRPMSGQGR
jgi:hypothetical protein